MSTYVFDHNSKKNQNRNNTDHIITNMSCDVSKLTFNFINL